MIKIEPSTISAGGDGDDTLDCGTDNSAGDGYYMHPNGSTSNCEYVLTW